MFTSENNTHLNQLQTLGLRHVDRSVWRAPKQSYAKQERQHADAARISKVGPNYEDDFDDHGGEGRGVEGGDTTIEGARQRCFVGGGGSARVSDLQWQL